MDFLIRECAACALVHLDRPKEERLLSCFLGVEEAAETHRWVGQLTARASSTSSTPFISSPPLLVRREESSVSDGPPGRSSAL